MLPAKLALATTMLVAAPAYLYVTGADDSARSISDPKGHVFSAPAQNAGAAPVSQPRIAPAQSPGSAQAAEAPHRIVKVLVDSPFALPAGTVAIPAYDMAKPGPVPTPGSTLGAVSATPTELSAAKPSPPREARAAMAVKQRAAKAEGRWKVAPGAYAEDSGDEYTAALAEDAYPSPAPQRRSRPAPRARYADRAPSGPLSVFSVLFR